MNKRVYADIGIILLIAVSFRLLLVLLLARADWPGSIPGYDHDAVEYHTLAIAILRGEGLVNLYRMPLYPCFLALLYKVFGIWFLPVRIIQILIGSATCCVLYFFVRTVRNDRNEAYWSALLLAVYPFHAIYSTILITETVFIALFVTALFLFARSLVRQSPVISIPAGMVFGLSLLCRPVVLPLVVVLSVYCIAAGCDLRRKLQTCICLIGGFLIVVSPWGFANARVYGQYRLLPPGNGGGIMLLGTYDATELKRGDYEMYLRSWQTVMASADARQAALIDRQTFRVAIRRIRNAPGKYVLIRTRAVVKGWTEGNDMQFGLSTPMRECVRERQYGALLGKILLRLVQPVVLLFAAVGVLFRRRSRYDPVMLIPLWYHVLIFLPLYVELRYLVPIMPCVLLFTVLGTNTLASRLFSVGHNAGRNSKTLGSG